MHSCSKGGMFLMGGYPARDMSFTTSSKFPSKSFNLECFTGMGLLDMFVTPSMLQDEENSTSPFVFKIVSASPSQSTVASRESAHHRPTISLLLQTHGKPTFHVFHAGCGLATLGKRTLCGMCAKKMWIVCDLCCRKFRRRVCDILSTTPTRRWNFQARKFDVTLKRQSQHLVFVVFLYMQPGLCL